MHLREDETGALQTERPGWGVLWVGGPVIQRAPPPLSSVQCRGRDFRPSEIHIFT